MIEGAERKAHGDFRPTSEPIAIAIDTVADAALVARRNQGHPSQLRCDVCDAVIVGEPGGSGFYLWTRGDEVRVEEPPLCRGCATVIGMAAMMSSSVEEEEG